MLPPNRRRRLRPATKPEVVAEEAEADLLVAESKHAQRHGKKGSSKKEKKEGATKSSKVRIPPSAAKSPRNSVSDMGPYTQSGTKAGGKDSLRGAGSSSSSKAGTGAKGEAGDSDSVFISRHRQIGRAHV